MKAGPKYKLAKRLGASIFEKTQGQKFAIAEERSAKNKKRGRGGQSEYSKQLLEKQKVRVTYGIMERQFRRYVAEAVAKKGHSPITNLHQALELRLDNVVYRLGLAPTRRAARQMVSHGHVTVDGKKTTIPSRRISPGERIAVREGSRSAKMFEGFEERFMDRPLPSWLTWNPKSMEGSVAEYPPADAGDPAGDLAAVLSFYSR